MIRELLNQKILKYLRVLANESYIDDYLRGWSWFKEPVRPSSDIIKLSVSDIANRYCTTMRDIYLKYVLNVDSKPSLPMLWGRAIHGVFRKCIEFIRRTLLSNEILTGYELVLTIDENIDEIVNPVITEIKTYVNDENFLEKLRKACINFTKFLTIQFASRIDLEISRNGKLVDNNDLVNHVIPFLIEYKIDGSLIGLKENLKVDILTYNVIIEVKCGKIEYFHKLALAGYALAIESDLEIPIDYGILLYVNFTNDKLLPKVKLIPIFVSNELRKEFLELRDNAIEIILHEKDPGISNNCPIDCPYKEYCLRE